MNCRLKNRYKVIADYISGDLQESEITSFEAHVLDCRDCFEEAASLEKTVLLIQAEGPGAFAPQYSKPIFERIIIFLKNIVRVPIRIAGYATLLIFIGLSTFSFMKYQSEIHSYFVFETSEDLFRGLRETVLGQATDHERLKYFFADGLGAFESERYDEALAIFSTMNSDIQRRNISDQEKINWQYKIQLYLGATKVMLWQHQKPGYFNWLGMKIRAQEFDMTLLNDAEQHLSTAAHLSKTAHHVAKEEEILNTLLTIIRGRLNSQ